MMTLLARAVRDGGATACTSAAPLAAALSLAAAALTGQGSTAALAAQAAAAAAPMRWGQPQLQQARGMAVVVDVSEGKLDAALSALARKREEAGVPDELRKRRYYRNGMDQRFDRERKAYSKAVGRIVTEQVMWAARRKRIRCVGGGGRLRLG